MTNLAGPPAETREGPAKFVPGQPDMWMFVLFETLLFTGTSPSTWCRVPRIARVPCIAGRPHLRVGVLNTIALLLSSWAIAGCVQAARSGDHPSALKKAYLTACFGVVFLVSKIVEWVREIRQGNTFTSDEFFSHYYFLTSIHSIHRADRLRRAWCGGLSAAKPRRRSVQLIETCATYWHTVDLFWVLIFALLYVVR